MFTGIVTELGTVVDVGTATGIRRITIDAGSLGVAVGGSIAVNGVCLTVVSGDGSTVAAEVMEETLNRTNLGTLEPGGRVNLEKAVGPGSLFEGHIVQGHVDGVAEIVDIRQEGESRRLSLRGPAGLGRYIVEKGSIALDGVSLTVTRVDGDEFEVALIPHTLAVTNLGLKHPGDSVNVELDVIAKYVEKLVT